MESIFFSKEWYLVQAVASASTAIEVTTIDAQVDHGAKDEVTAVDTTLLHSRITSAYSWSQIFLQNLN